MGFNINTSSVEVAALLGTAASALISKRRSIRALADIGDLLAETRTAHAVAPEETVAQDCKPARRPLPETLPRGVIEHVAPGHD